MDKRETATRRSNLMGNSFFARSLSSFVTSAITNSTEAPVVTEVPTPAPAPVTAAPSPKPLDAATSEQANALAKAKAQAAVDAQAAADAQAAKEQSAAKQALGSDLQSEPDRLVLTLVPDNGGGPASSSK